MDASFPYIRQCGLVRESKSFKAGVQTVSYLVNIVFLYHIKIFIESQYCRAMKKLQVIYVGLFLMVYIVVCRADDMADDDDIAWEQYKVKFRTSVS